ncbi:uncharacterized protein METZ01_LOCUS467591 [marine metagenome]|uniref:Uncharacterized protein n=1 Tax=marine metagenome TaxID=408172 RepID=A0A383B3P9_9ZZZZ
MYNEKYADPRVPSQFAYAVIGKPATNGKTIYKKTLKKNTFHLFHRKLYLVF